MFILRRLLTAIVPAVFFAVPAFADWIVARVSQPARYAVDGRTWHQLSLGMVLPNNAWIHTGRRGRVLLRHANDIVQFKPNTVAALSWRLSRGADETTIFQKYGSVLLFVEPRADQTRTVETPLLAAIVRGTRFEVEVALDGVELRVDEGVVTTTHLERGERVDVTGGQRALAPAYGGFSVRGLGPRRPSVSVAPRAPRVGSAVSGTPGGDAGMDNDDNGEGFRDRLREERTRARLEEVEDRDGGRGDKERGQKDDRKGGGKGGKGGGKGGKGGDRGGGDDDGGDRTGRRADDPG